MSEAVQEKVLGESELPNGEAKAADETPAENIANDKKLKKKKPNNKKPSKFFSFFYRHHHCIALIPINSCLCVRICSMGKKFHCV